MIDAGRFAGTARFEIVRQIGAGGMGVVFEAHDRELDARVALKLLPNVDAPALYNFKREFRSLATLVHPNLIGLHELISEGDAWFFTMELLDGEDFLAFARPSGANHDRLADALWQLATGLSALHDAGVLHLDLKPGNVLVRRDGRLAILDFGLAREVGAELLQDETASGTLAYMAPEQALGEALTPATDWYAVGSMLFEALTGALPFVGSPMHVVRQKVAGALPPLETLAPDAPEPLRSLCAELLQPEPERRPGASEVLAVLGGLRLRRTTEEHRASAAPLTFVGRQRQLRILADVAAEVRDGRTILLQVDGRSGAGKSTLVGHYLDQLRANGDAVILAGRCYEQESVPYKGIDALIDALTRHLLRLSDDEVDAILPDRVAGLARIFPVLERIAAIAAAAGAFEATPDLREMRRQAFAALAELLGRVARQTLLVLYVDDLQWGDQDSAALLIDILQSPLAAPLLVIAAYRSEYEDQSACLRALREAREIAPARRQLHVEPFDAEESLTLARQLLGPEGRSEAAERIAQESRGSPYFIFELARYAREHAGELAGGPVAGALVLDEVLWTRVSGLPAGDREVLELLAVSGRPLRLLHARESLDARRIDQIAIARMRAEHLVRTTGPRLTDELEVYHDRIRETITARLDAARRRGHHARLAGTLESAPDVDAETVGWHFEGAGEAVRAGAHYERAAAIAARSLAFERAARLYRRSIELRPDLGATAAPMYVELGHALANAGRGVEAAAAYQAAARLTGGDRQTELLRLAATQLCSSGNIDEGRELFRGVMRRVGLRMPATSAGNFASLLVRRARLATRTLTATPRAGVAYDPRDLARVDVLWSVSTSLSAVDVVGVASLQSQALLLALRAGEPRRLARCLAWEAVLTGTGGWRAAGRAGELLDAAGRVARALPEPHAEGMVRLARGWVAFLQLRMQDALAECDAAEAIFRERCTGVAWELAITRTMIAWALTHSGVTEPLRACVQRYYGEARDRDDRFLVTNLAAVALPHLELVAGDPGAAAAHLDEALALWPHKGFHIQHVSLRFSRTLLHLYRGDGSAALAGITADWPGLRWSLQLQNQVTRVMMVDLRARSAIAAARDARTPDRAGLLAAAERDGRRLRRERAPWAEAYADRILGGVALVSGRSADAAPLLRSAEQGLDRAGLRLHSAATRRQLGALLGGDEGRALVASADAAFASQHVRDADRMTAAFGV